MPVLSIEEMLRDDIISLRAEIVARDLKIAALALRNTELVIRIDELEHPERPPELSPPPPAPASEGGKIINLGARLKRRPTIFELPDAGKKG